MGGCHALYDTREMRHLIRHQHQIYFLGNASLTLGRMRNLFSLAGRRYFPERLYGSIAMVKRFADRHKYADFQLFQKSSFIFYMCRVSLFLTTADSYVDLLCPEKQVRLWSVCHQSKVVSVASKRRQNTDTM